jgi:MFS family permease
LSQCARRAIDRFEVVISGFRKGRNVTIPPSQHAAIGEDQEVRFNRPYIFASALTAALGGLMFGYDWVVIGGAEPFYEKYFHLASSAQIGWAMSSALIGALSGAMFSGILSDGFGRKPLLVASGLLFVVSSIGTGTAPTFALFILSRLLGAWLSALLPISPLFTLLKWRLQACGAALSL